MTGIRRLLYGAKVDTVDAPPDAFDRAAPPARVWLDQQVEQACQGHLAAATATGHLLEWDVDPWIGQVVADPDVLARELDDRLFLALRDAPRVLVEVVARKCADHVELYVLGGADVAEPLVLRCA